MLSGVIRLMELGGTGLYRMGGAIGYGCVVCRGITVVVVRTVANARSLESV